MQNETKNKKEELLCLLRDAEDAAREIGSCCIWIGSSEVLLLLACLLPLQYFNHS